MSSISRSHPLHIQRLRRAQGLARGQAIRIKRLQRAYAFRDRRDAFFYAQIRLADPAERPALEQEHQLEYVKHKAEIDRYSYSGSGEFCSLALVSDSDEGRRDLISLAFFAVQQAQAASSVVEFDLALASVLDLDPSPPGLEIRETPRRPGAPSFANFHFE